MITRSRIRLLSNLGAFVCVAGICFAWKTGHSLTPTEEKIIGTWEFSGIDATGRVVFRRDHTVVELLREDDIVPKWAAGAAGKWRLEGNEIIADQEILPIPGMTPFPKRITRTSIREFHDDRLVRGGGRSDLVRIKPSAQLFVRIGALICVVAVLAALLTALRRFQKSPFRKDFVWFAVAAAVAFLWCALALVGDLAETGALVIPPFSLRSVYLPTQLLWAAWIAIFTAGVLKLGFSFASNRKHKQVR